MKELFEHLLYFGVVVSVVGYDIGLWLKKKTNFSLFNPLLIAVIFVMGFLSLFHIQYEAYEESASLLSYLLTPATVCLAVPLYEQLELLKKQYKAILFGVISGMVSGLISIFLLSLLFHLNHTQYVTLLPKSITTAIGMGVSEEIGGNVTITVAAIVVTGILGNVIGEVVLRFFHIKEPIAKGIALGAASHAIGTSKAMEIGEVEGAMSSLSLAITGLLTVIAAPIFANFM